MDTTPAERQALVATRIAEQSAYLTRVARSRVRDEQAAAEAVQETLLAALECADRFDGRATLRTWLTGILLHKIHDGFRRQARYVPVDEEDLPEPVDHATPERSLYGRRLWAAFMRALADMPARQAQALMLREFEGLADARACRKLGVSHGNYWVLLHRAKSRVRQALAQEGFAA
jgi:RNA polymerase sigma-70 factor (ECF subfamily)